MALNVATAALAARELQALGRAAVTSAVSGPTRTRTRLPTGTSDPTRRGCGSASSRRRVGARRRPPTGSTTTPTAPSRSRSERAVAAVLQRSPRSARRRAGRARPRRRFAPVKLATNGVGRGARRARPPSPSWREPPSTMTPTRSASAAASSKSCVTSSAAARAPRRSSLELAAHAPPRVRVERGQRLVEEQHGRLAGERARERDPLALAAGELGRAARRARWAMPKRSSSSSARAWPRERHVLAHAHVREERVVLEHEPTRRSSGGRLIRRSASKRTSSPQRDAAALGAARAPAIARSTRRLARARRPHEREGLPPRPRALLEARRREAEQRRRRESARHGGTNLSGERGRRARRATSRAPMARRRRSRRRTARRSRAAASE